MLKESIDVRNGSKLCRQYDSTFERSHYHHLPVTFSPPSCIQSIASYRCNGVKFVIEEYTVVLSSQKPDNRWTNYRVPVEFSSFQAVTCHSSKEKIYVYIALPLMPSSSK